MDEMSLQREHNPFYRWSKKGETTKVRFARDKSKKVYFFGGLSFRDKTQIAHLAETKKSLDFIKFLEEVKRRYRREITQKLPQHLESLRESEDGKYKGLVLVVLDGDSTHRSNETKAWLEKNYGMLEFLRLPTYSPDLNPQEHVWRALRKHLSRVEGKYTFGQTIDRACRFLLTQKFNYQFA